jgi:hypothetical protein
MLIPKHATLVPKGISLSKGTTPRARFLLEFPPIEGNRANLQPRINFKRRRNLCSIPILTQTDEVKDRRGRELKSLALSETPNPSETNLTPW